MSVKNLLKMKASIKRPTLTKDKLGNVSTTSYSDINTAANCYIFPFKYDGGIGNKGQGFDIEGKFMGMFFPEENILEGDKITCDMFSPPEFYVDKAYPIIHPRSGKKHHTEAILSIAVT